MTHPELRAVRHTWRIDFATQVDAPAIAALVNRAYRPSSPSLGWTHESALVAGPRTSAAAVAALLGPKSRVLIARSTTTIAACVHVRCIAQCAVIGMLATEPTLQNLGLGKRLLEHAERLAQDEFGASRLSVEVLSHRPELLAFYERRGYVRTGHTEAYPVDLGIGTPRTPHLTVLTLSKRGRSPG